MRRRVAALVLAGFAGAVTGAAACGLAPSGLGGADGGATDVDAAPPRIDPADADVDVGPCHAGACTPRVLARAQNDPNAIALDGEDVFWVNRGSLGASPAYSDGSVMRASKDGVTVAAVFARAADEYRAPASLVAVGGVLAWGCSKGGAILRSDRVGAMPVTVSVGQLAPAGVAFDPASRDLFWTNAGDAVRSIVRQPGVGGPEETLASEARGASSIAIDADHVYWAASVDGSVKRVRRDGTCAASACPEVLVPPRGTEGTVRIAVEGATLYASNAEEGQVVEVALASEAGPVTRVVASRPHALGAALDAEHVYFVTYEESGEVWRARRDGGGSEVLATGQPFPHAIAVDARAVYWVNRGSQTSASGDVHDARDGAVMRLPK